jgi:hypothetical protein
MKDAVNYMYRLVLRLFVSQPSEQVNARVMYRLADLNGAEITPAIRGTLWDLLGCLDWSRRLVRVREPARVQIDATPWLLAPTRCLEHTSLRAWEQLWRLLRVSPSGQAFASLREEMTLRHVTGTARHPLRFSDWSAVMNTVGNYVVFESKTRSLEPGYSMFATAIGDDDE